MNAPEGSQPTEPTILYKYRNWDNCYHRNILLLNELYFASPKDINDPFDCRIPPDFRLLDTIEKREKYIDTLINDNYQELIEFGLKQIQIEKLKIKTLELLRNDLSAFQNQYENDFQVQNDHFGVLSLSSKWDSIAMWSHYAFNHKGFCIGFWINELRKTLGNNVDFGKVKYEVNFPSIDPFKYKSRNITDVMNTSRQEIFTKSKDWCYEDEYRLLKIIFDKRNDGQIAKINDDCFAEIILGINIEKSNEDQIKLIAKQKMIPVYKAEKVPFKFLLDRKEIKNS